MSESAEVRNPLTDTATGGTSAYRGWRILIDFLFFPVGCWQQLTEN